MVTLTVAEAEVEVGAAQPERFNGKQGTLNKRESGEEQ